MAVVATFDGTSDVTVSGFDPSVDQVQLALAVTAIASVAKRGNDIVITSTSGFTLTIEDTALAELVEGAAGSLPLFGGGTFWVGDGTVNTVPDPLANTLTGSVNSDVLMGLGGNDTIDGNGGSDLVYAGGGNDRIAVTDLGSTTAVTRVNGGAGNDTIDVLTGGTATVKAGDGDDSVTNGASTDNASVLVQGAKGNDTIDYSAFLGSATIGGGKGDDTVELNVATGEAGSILGGLGADTIGVTVAGTGTVTIYGSDPSADAADGGDAISISSIAGATGTVFVNGFGGNDSIFLDVATGTVGGGQGDDSITATFNVGSGTLVSGLGADTVIGVNDGTGLLAVKTTNANGASVDGGDNVTVVGLVTNNATLNTGYGNDSIIVSTFAAISIKAGGGDDTVVMAGLEVAASVSTGGGNDSVSVGADGGTVSHAYTLGGGADTISVVLDGDAGSLYTVADFTANDLAILANLPTNVATTGGALILDNGFDSVSFTGGADQLITVEISGAGQGDFIRNGSGTGSDLVGTTDADSIISVFAADTIEGGGGADTLQGGLNDNLFVFTGAQLLAVGPVNGGGGADTVEVTGGVAAYTTNNIVDVDAFTFSGTSDIDLTIAVGTFSAAGGAISASGLTAGASLLLDATAVGVGPVTVVGGAGDDDLNTSGFADSVTAGQGNDSVFGNAGSDIIGGGQGDDNIAGSADADMMTGGQGSNNFFYISLAAISTDTGTTNATADTITDFKTATDTIETGVAGAGNFAEAIVAAAVNTIAQAVAAYDTGSGIGTDQFYTFFTNGTDGYLIVDSTADGSADGAILLAGLNDLDDFAASNII
jgi:hypothetical protein